MPEYMHIIGTEQVQSAANIMRDAAERMTRAANTIHNAMQRHEQVMQDLMIKMDDLIDVIDGEEE
jgi:N-acetylglucosamine kinase-like BadF-type ATPase